MAARLDNNLVFQEDSWIIQDTTNPSLNQFNLSGKVNASTKTTVNFVTTINISDSNPETAFIYVNDTLNTTTTYQNNISQNISIIAGDGYYRVKVGANDSAGNYVNFSNLLDIAINLPADSSDSGDSAGGPSNTESGAAGSVSPGATEQKQITTEVSEETKQAIQVAQCSKDLPFIDRVFSKCKIADNGICDDGENLFIDEECTMSVEEVGSGKVFEYMWLLRAMLLLVIFLLATNSPSQ